MTCKLPWRFKFSDLSTAAANYWQIILVRFSFPDLMALLVYDNLASMLIQLMIFSLKSVVNAKYNPKGTIWEHQNMAGRPWVLLIVAEGKFDTGSIKTNDFWAGSTCHLCQVLEDNNQARNRSMCYSFIHPRAGSTSRIVRELQASKQRFWQLLRFSLLICKGLVFSYEATDINQRFSSSTEEMRVL